MASREEILADFQACTGIDDLDIAICHLEESNWVLVDAVNKTLTSEALPPPAPVASAASAATASLPQDAASNSETNSNHSSSMDVSGPPLPTPPQPFSLRHDIMGSGNRAAGSSSSSSSLVGVDVAPPLAPPRNESSMAGGGPSPSSSAPYVSFSNTGPINIADDMYAAGPSGFGSTGRTRMLDFYVTHYDRTFKLRVPDNEDVKTLKQLIQAETKCPPCQQTIRGLNGNSSLLTSNRRRLSDLNLPKENFLHLITPDPEDINGVESKPEEPGDFKLIINDVNAGKTYNLNFRPTHTVLSVKLDMAGLVSIPVSKQVWTGWPKDISDDLSLAQIGIPQEHKLTVDTSGAKNMPVLDDSGASSSSSVANNTNNRHNEVVMIDSDDDFEDAFSSNRTLDDEDDEDYFSSNQGGSSFGNKRLQPLIPDDYGDEALASIKFSEEFAARYGSPHPLFFPGTLDEAIKEACIKPAKDRKMVAIYLHHDSSVLTNVFCTQVLCADSVVGFLSENFVTFGWDLTLSSNKKRALDMITNQFGSVAAATVRNLDIEKLPLIALVYRLRGTTEIFQMINGNVSLDELMSQLLTAHDTYTSQLTVEIREEGEREARNAVKAEQDLAFEMAQMADREKEQQKQREEEERMEKERIEEAIRRSEEEAKLKEEQEKEKLMAKAKSKLPDEPPADVKHAKIRIRVPELSEDEPAKNLQRRFLPNDTLKIVFDYLLSEGFPVEKFKVLSSWPRRDVTTLDASETLEALKLFPQETLTLEERD